MTHDKLLQEITTEFSGSSQFGGSEKIYQALYAVVKLCRDYSGAYQRVNEEFENGLNVAFALVIQAIEKGLR